MTYLWKELLFLFRKESHTISFLLHHLQALKLIAVLHVAMSLQNICSVKNQKNYTEATHYNLFSLTCLYKYLFLETIPTNLWKKVQQQCFMKPSEFLHHRCYLITKYLVWFQIWSSPHVKVYVKLRFCFNERLKCSVVIWFQSSLNLTLDLP